jgi:hypothetical protein
MKHQYFGDVNDYRKYGLLRSLQSESGLRLGVNWMLTPDDGRNDGKFVTYLADPSRWRRYDPSLFDALAAAVPRGRHIDRVVEHGVLENATFVDTIVPDSRSQRLSFFAVASKQLAETDLVFFDPDNGVEVPSCPAGRKNSSKYLLKAEIAATYRRGQSVIIYQHFIREARAPFIARLSTDLSGLTGTSPVHCFTTANVAFFLIPQLEHAMALTAAANEVSRRWMGQISHSELSGA